MDQETLNFYLTPVNKLSFSPGTKNFFAKKRILYVAHLLAHTEKELGKEKGFNRQCRLEIRNLLGNKTDAIPLCDHKEILMNCNSPEELSTTLNTIFNNLENCNLLTHQTVRDTFVLTGYD